MVLEFSGPSEGEPSTFGLLPADLDGTTPPPPGSAGLFLVLRNLNLGDAFDGLEVWEARPTWTPPPGLPTFSFTLAATLPVERFDSALCSANANIRNCIPQPGSAFGLDALPGQLIHRLAYRNIAGIESLVVNHVVDVSGSDHAGIRWYELRRAAGVWSVAQQNSFAPDADHRWVASTAMDAAGNIALGYSVSGLTTFPSLRFVGRFSTDAPSLLTHGEQTLIAGGGSQTHPSSRWGDYSTLSVDPADGCTFWFTGEYYPLSDTGGDIGRSRLVALRRHEPLPGRVVGPLHVAWTPPSANCGVDGYSFSWDSGRSAALSPGTAKDLEETETTTISPPLADGESNYLHPHRQRRERERRRPFSPLQIDSPNPTRARLHGTRLKQTYQRDRSFAMRVSAKDTGSGIATYAVEARRATVKRKFGKRKVVGKADIDAKKTFTGKLGSTYCFSGVATDAAGNVSDRSKERCTVIPLDDRAFPRAPGWTRSKSRASYRGSVTVSRVAGSTLRRGGIAGRGLALIARRCPNCGVVRVSFRGKVLKTINLGAKPFGRRQVVRLASFDRLRRGSLVIEALSSGKLIEIDGLGVRRA